MLVQVLVLASQKGGSGKSTIAASLAVAAWQAGERVVVVDMDPQASLAEWGRLREPGGIVFRAVAASSLDRWITETRKVPAVSLVIIDTAGTFGPEVDTALKHARTADAVAALEVGGAVAPPIADRTDFRDSVASGLGVTEIAPAGKAAGEITALWRYTKERMSRT